MKKLVLVIVLMFLTAFTNLGQTRKVPVKSAPVKTSQSQSAPPQNLNKISDNEWNEIVTVLKAENWERSSTLISAALKKLKTDNEDKQLARLRYLYLYTVAGKVSQGAVTFGELEKESDAFIGQDFLMPSREIAADCNEKIKKVNYICPVIDNEKALRVTAINNAATSILTFEYVQLPEKLDFAANKGKQVYIGGKLRKVELNSNESTVWIMRLFFENGVLLLKNDPLQK